MINQIIYDSETKSFSALTSDKMKDYAIITAASIAITSIPKILTVIAKHYGAKKKDEILMDKNAHLNELMDNYGAGIKADASPAQVKKYNKEIHKLISDTLALVDPDNLGYYIDPDTKIRTELKPTLFNTTIAPVLGLLRAITIRDIHFLPGTKVGADRRSFEIVFDPNHRDPEEVARQPFRNVLLKLKWPSHGFEVEKVGAHEANVFISDLVDFLSKNPKYLSIRVK